MATVKIGGRVLEVRQMTLGMVKREIMPRTQKMKSATTAGDMVDLIIEELVMFLGHNEGVTVDWLLDNVSSAKAQSLMAAVRAAADEEAEPSQGEAPRP